MQNPSRGGQTTSTEKLEELASILQGRMKGRKGGQNYRLARVLGILTKDNQIKANIPNEDRSRYAVTRYQFLLREDAPRVSNKCCNVMKKEPSHKYGRKTKRTCITGEMASESMTRTQKWLQNGCNGFHLKNPKSTPLAFWTEQDILLYIKTYNIPICSVYGDIIADESKLQFPEGQMQINEDGSITESECRLKTSGCQRTGCMFCGFGCTQEREGEGRFERMKETHPKQYEWIMRDWDKGGLGYKNVIDWINENGHLNIRY